MPYDSAYDVLKSATCTIAECVDVIEELGIQYGYIMATAAFGIRSDTDIDLVRIKVLVEALKFRIAQLSK